MTEPLPHEVDYALWAEACRRAVAIRKFMESSSAQSTVAAMSYPGNSDTNVGYDLLSADLRRVGD